MTEYKVQWEMNVEADSPREACEKVWTEIFHRSPVVQPDDACVFTVIEGDGIREIDLAKN